MSIEREYKVCLFENDQLIDETCIDDICDFLQEGEPNMDDLKNKEILSIFDVEIQQHDHIHYI